MRKPLSEDPRDVAAMIAYGLGITMYVRDGKVSQSPPGEKFDPPEFETLAGKALAEIK